MKKERPKMIAQTTVISMGWTKAMINKLLPEPELKDNPNYRSAAPMKLWPEELVKRVMETEEYRTEKEKADRRKKSAQKAAETRIVNFCNRAEDRAGTIEIIVLDDDELRERTLRHQEAIIEGREYAFQAYIERQQERGYRRGEYKSLEEYCEEEGKDYNYYFENDIPRDIKVHLSNVKEETMQRWIVNYIRHQLTLYDGVLRGFKGNAGTDEASSRFKNALLDQIAKYYPAYKDECERQKVEVVYHTGTRMEKDYLYA